MRLLKAKDVQVKGCDAPKMSQLSNPSTTILSNIPIASFHDSNGYKRADPELFISPHHIL